MPRANRHYLPGYIWHIIHRCHKREFLLKFAKDKQRYTLINRQKLMDMLGIADHEQLCRSHKKWVEEILKSGSNKREPKWTESIAIGSKEFVEETQTKLGIKAKGRNVVANNEAYELREPKIPYDQVFDPKKVRLKQNNSYFWGSFCENSK